MENYKNPDAARVKWRIYRLPGSRENWHVDSGQGTPIVNVRGFEIFVPSRSVDIGGENVPRAWIEIALDAEFFIVAGNALFIPGEKLCAAVSEDVSAVALAAAEQGTADCAAPKADVAAAATE
jgi:hypothetical protein